MYFRVNFIFQSSLPLHESEYIRGILISRVVYAGKKSNSHHCDQIS